MSIEVAGEVLAEAVIADELAGAGARAAGPHQANCANCGTALTGRYCHQCGQVGHVHRSLLHMVEEFLHGIFHFDTKAWRTLPALAFHPGRLTRSYIDGQRTRHVSPLALFLFMVFVMVMVFSFTSSPDDLTTQSGENARSRVVRKIEVAQAKQQQLQSEIDLKDGSPAKQARLEQRLAEQQQKIVALQAILKSLEADAASGKPESKEAEATAESKADEAVAMRQLADNVPWLANGYMARKLAHAVNNKELVLYKIKGAASKFAVLLMPIALPFLWLLFPFSRRFTMFDHAVFSLYSLSFMAALMTLLALLGTLNLGGVVVALALLAPPAHMFAQLRGTYQLSRFGATWRTIALLFVALCSLLIYGLLIVFVSM